jgi:hypothetical protein
LGNPIEKILIKLDNHNLLTDLSEKLSGSKFNSLLLKVFKLRAVKIRPAQLLNEFESNRFFVPSAIDTIKELLTTMRMAKNRTTHGLCSCYAFPCSALGTCSSVGTVSQNKVMSSVRGTEVVADATNALALKIAQEFKKTTSRDVIKFSAMHRHVRGQFFDNPSFAAHFGIFVWLTEELTGVVIHLNCNKSTTTLALFWNCLKFLSPPRESA